MMPEIFKLAMLGRVLVFIIAPDRERMNAIGNAVQSLGGMVLDSQMFAVKREIATPEGLRDAIGELQPNERVYLIDAVGDALENHVIVRPKTEGGIAVG